jgi:thiol-disulfide isomerase/thioredoxin
MPLRTDIVAVFLAMAVASGAVGSDDPRPTGIDFVESIDEARLLTEDAPRPIVVQFGATWCGWCRRLEETTLRDATIVALADRFAWVHVDVDAEPELAQRFGARALPHAVAIDGDGRVLAELRGYADAGRYAAFLASAEAAFIPPKPTASEPLDAAEVAARVETIVASMAPATATGRQQSLAAIRRLGPAAFPALIELLEERRLAQRAAAAFALSDLAEGAPSFDPMGDASTRTEQVVAWRAWLATPAATRLRAPAAAPAPPTRPTPQESPQRTRGIAAR